MLFELILALLAGILAGTFTGLAPGIHINLIAAILLSSLSSLSSVPVLALAIFITSMSITHTFIDFIPSIFLGAPEEDTFLSILPGHEMLKEGLGYNAAIITLYGSLIAIPIFLFFTPFFIIFLPSLFTILKNFIPFILILLSSYLILREKEYILSFSVFLLAGFLGFFTFQLPVKEPLLPLLSGLFGLSSLIISLKEKQQIKKQKISPLKKIKLTKKEFLKSFLAAGISAPLCSFLPGIGSGHAATLGSEFIPQSRKGFLLLIGSINTIIMSLSFVTLYAINKTRSGSAVAIKEILKEITLAHLTIIIIASLLAGIIAFFIGIKISKLFALYINRINYSKLTLLVIVILIIINLLFSNWLGLIVLITATSLGIYTILSNSRRINLMGSLIIPAIIFYLIN